MDNFSSSSSSSYSLNPIDAIGDEDDDDDEHMAESIIIKAFHIVSHTLDKYTVPQDFIKEKKNNSDPDKKLYLDPRFDEFSLNLLTRQAILCLIIDKEDRFKFNPERKVINKKNTDSSNDDSITDTRYIDIYLEDTKYNKFIVVELKYYHITYLCKHNNEPSAQIEWPKLLDWNYLKNEYWSKNSFTSKMESLKTKLEEWEKDFQQFQYIYSSTVPTISINTLEKYGVFIPNVKNEIENKNNNNINQDTTITTTSKKNNGEIYSLKNLLFVDKLNSHTESHLKQLNTQIEYLEKELFFKLKKNKNKKNNDINPLKPENKLNPDKEVNNNNNNSTSNTFSIIGFVLLGFYNKLFYIKQTVNHGVKQLFNASPHEHVPNNRHVRGSSTRYYSNNSISNSMLELFYVTDVIIPKKHRVFLRDPLPNTTPNTDDNNIIANASNTTVNVSIPSTSSSSATTGTTIFPRYG